MSRSVFPLLVLLGLGLLGCDTTATLPDSQVVVEAYLEAGAPLPSIRLSRTADVDATYDPDETAVSNADVAITRLGPRDTTVAYPENDTVPGLYTPARDLTVHPQATYRLTATTSDGTTLTSTTTVPGPVEIVQTKNDTAVYQSPQQPSLTIELAPRAERQNVFTFTTTSLLDFGSTPDSALAAQLTPFYADSYDADDDSLESFRISSSGLLNEGNFERNEAEGTITIELPWLAVAFYGPNEAAVNVVDDNYYDLLRSQQVQQSGLSPGEIPNVIEHVEGGAGIFGSYARAPNSIFIRRPGAPAP